MATQNTNSNGDKKGFLPRLGILWGPKTGKTGTQYYSGTINLKEIGEDKDIPVVVFQNNSKREGKKDPDLQIFLSTPREGSAPPPAKKAEKPKSAPVPRDEESLPSSDEGETL